MAFTLIEKSTNRVNGRVAATDVRLAKSIKNGCVQVSVPLTIAEPLGWQKGDKVRLEAGTGEDDGWFRVAKHSNGFVIGRSGDNDKRLKFASSGILRHLRHLKSFPATSCRHIVSGDALLIEVPARLRGERFRWPHNAAIYQTK